MLILRKYSHSFASLDFRIVKSSDKEFMSNCHSSTLVGVNFGCLPAFKVKMKHFWLRNIWSIDGHSNRQCNNCHSSSEQTLLQSPGFVYVLCYTKKLSKRVGSAEKANLKGNLVRSEQCRYGSRLLRHTQDIVLGEMNVS